MDGGVRPAKPSPGPHRVSLSAVISGLTGYRKLLILAEGKKSPLYFQTHG